VLGLNNKRRLVKTIFLCLFAIVLSWGLVSCGDRIEATSPSRKASRPPVRVKLSEVAPPNIIQQLNQTLENYHPQVTILSPRPDAVLEDTTVELAVQVRDLPIFKDEELGMGPHLKAIVDNRLEQEIYDLDRPIVFEDLEPGTHTVRVFASRPWNESFKNEGAYAQATFHIFSKTGDNAPDASQPLLTYNSPVGRYRAEPILLDFYLTNAPLHIIARESSEDDIKDWRIRITADGQSFVTDSWQPLYLQGFLSGKNWVQIEFLDEQGESVRNAFNNTVKLVTYEPGGEDTLAQLMRDELPLSDALAMVDPNYVKPESPPEEVLEPEVIEPSVEVEEEILTEPVEEEIPSEPEVVESSPDEEEEEAIAPEVPAAIEEPETLEVEVSEPTEILEESPVVEVEEEVPTEPEVVEPSPEEEEEEAIAPEVPAAIEESETLEVEVSEPTEIVDESPVVEVEEEIPSEPEVVESSPEEEEGKEQPLQFKEVQPSESESPQSRFKFLNRFLKR